MKSRKCRCLSARAGTWLKAYLALGGVAVTLMAEK